MPSPRNTFGSRSFPNSGFPVLVTGASVTRAAPGALTVTGVRLDLPDHPIVKGRFAIVRTAKAGSSAPAPQDDATSTNLFAPSKGHIEVDVGQHPDHPPIRLGAVVCWVNAREEPAGSGTFMCDQIVPVTHGPDPAEGGAVIGWFSLFTHPLDKASVVHHAHVQQTRLAQSPLELLNKMSTALSSSLFGGYPSIALRLLRWSKRSIYPEAMILPTDDQGGFLIEPLNGVIPSQYAPYFSNDYLLQRLTNTQLGSALLSDSWKEGFAVEIIPISTYRIHMPNAGRLRDRSNSSHRPPAFSLGTLGVEAPVMSTTLPTATELLFTGMSTIPLDALPTAYFQTPPSGIDTLTGDFNGAF